MNYAIDYRRDKASVLEIADHLRQADGSFVPPLSDRVEIDAYAEKLVRVGRRYEAWAEGQLVGLVAGYLDDPAAGFISSVSVIPSWKRKGIGNALLAAFITHACVAGIRTVRLEVYRENDAALRLYRTLGFSEVNRSGDTLTMFMELDGAR